MARLRDPLAADPIRRQLNELQPDLVSTHSSKAGWLGRVTARSLGLPVLLTAHDWAFTRRVALMAAPFYRVAEKMAARFTTRIITVAEHDRELALRKGVCRSGQIETIHYGISPISDTCAQGRNGSPRASSNVAGIRESVEDGGTGLVIPPHEAAATRVGLERLLSSGALRKTMGAAGRRRFEERFTLDKMVDATIAVYEDVIHRPSRS